MGVEPWNQAGQRVKAPALCIVDRPWRRAPEALPDPWFPPSSLSLPSSHPRWESAQVAEERQRTEASPTATFSHTRARGECNLGESLGVIELPDFFTEKTQVPQLPQKAAEHGV